MNESVKKFVTSLGLLCETWTLTYNKFVEQGYSAKEAMNHTQAFMTAFLVASSQQGSGNKGA